MLQHPKPGETEEDLIKQNEAFKSKSNEDVYPAAKVVSIGKRKMEEVASDKSSAVDSESLNESKPKSRFAKAYPKKKKREGVIDNTILKEAVSRNDQRSAVLKPIVERNVPSLSPLMVHWQPTPSPHGFPQAPKLTLLERGSTDTPKSSSGSTFKKKSLYMRHMEKAEAVMDNVETTVNSQNSVDEELVSLGSQSFIIDGKSGLGKAEEAKRIHMENISKLSEMTHEERLRERNEIMSTLSSERVKFIQIFRQKKEEKLRGDIMDTKENGGETRKSEPAASLNKGVSLVESRIDEPMDQEEEDNMSSHSMNWELSTGNSKTLLSESKENELFKTGEENPLSELPIPPEEAKKWVHMGEVELEKLKWMTDVPKPKTLKGKEGYIARFNFQGDLLPYDSDISWREGLHHHGEEPGRAGYTLDELFLFVRSRVMQQRHLGLKTLANILRNANEGLYDTCFDTSVIQLMVDAGLVLLLRFSIDETTALVYQEALRALYFLISSEPDEIALSIAEPWTPLYAQPSVSSLTYSREKDRQELDAEEKELKDIEVIKLDIVRALVRMDVHIRLRYFLESVTLSPLDVIHIFGILKRIARHSLTAAWTLVKTPKLLATITQHFLPHNTTPLLCGKNVEQLTSVYGVPLSHALSFMKVLASRGRQIAITLLEKYDLVSRLMAYVSLESTEVQIPLAEVLRLTQEAYCLWSLFLSYGLVKSQQGFTTFYPLFIKQLIFYRDKVDINDKIESNQYNYEIGAHMANVFTKGLCVAATKSLLMSRMKNSEGSIISSDGKEIVLQPPTLDWQEFEEILTLSEICLLKWVNQFTRNFEVSFSGFKLLGSFCNFLGAYFYKWRDQTSFEGVSFVKKMEFIHSQILSSLLTKKVCDFLFKRLRAHSALCSTLKLGKNRDANNLGSLWSVCEEGRVTPILEKDSPFPFLLPFVNLLKTVYTLHPGLDANHIVSFLNNEQLESYFRDVCRSNHSLANQWFTRIEIYTITDILQLACLKGCDNYILYHQTALTILPLVHKGDEHIIKSLLTDVICNIEFAKDLAEIETHIDILTVKEYKPLKSPAISQPIISPIELTRRLFQLLPSVGQNLIKNLLHSRLLEKSLLRHNCIPFLINDLSIHTAEEITVLDPYWCLGPLKLLLHLNDVKSEQTTNQSEPETILSVTKWLQMTFFLLKYRKSVMVSHTNPMGWFRHLSNVFLASNDLFLDVNVSSYCQASLVAILDDEGYKKLDHSLTFADFQPCYDWYKRMVDHYASVSYGDSSFALFIIIPLLRKWPSSYKMLLFGEHVDALPFIRLHTEEVAQFIPLKRFLFPPEDDVNVIIKYRSAIGGQSINEKRTPFLHHFAMHHILQYSKAKEAEI